ncbi:unnamed protein product [Onchocerca ochengi]|uniref:RING-type domain-containing protein n=1 Tax=Onchocerca ochengi TaxID=42157 RepID=A0A182E5F2_ONCOC|nr:unnamed protein product [Onchocerca ochengi]
MERLEIEGVFGAVNAFAVDDDGQFAYLFDPRVDATIRINLSTGIKDVLIWYDRSFRHRRWLCYCMFAIQKDGSTYLPTLFYNTKRKHFVLVTFVTDLNNQVLYTYTENEINTDCIRFDRFAYNAHIDENIIYIIFYERFVRNNSTDDINATLFYVYCNYDCESHQMIIQKGPLPQGRWELPFIAHQHLHFLSTELSSSLLASIPMHENNESNEWTIRVVSGDQENKAPPRKAVWCNAWRNGMGWYVVSEKIINEKIQKITVWQLDVLDCLWKSLPLSIKTPLTIRNFALRIRNDNIALLHIDWDREGVFYKFDLAELMSKRPDGTAKQKRTDSELFQKIKNNKENVECIPTTASFYPNEIICPVCLDTYQDPRSLSCGHSICFNCVQQMRNIGQSNTIRCFACRKSTLIPANGLPVNFSLRDAIETLVRAKQLKLSGLRCVRCRQLHEDKNLWICLQCATDENITPVLNDGMDYFAKRAKKFAFCAQCILKQHSKHRLIEYYAFRSKYEIAKKTNEKVKKTVEEITQMLSTSIAESVEPLIIEPLQNSVLLELITACDVLSRCDEDDINHEVEAVIKAFRQRTINIANDLEKCIKYVKNVVLAHTRQKVTPIAERPTEL